MTEAIPISSIPPATVTAGDDCLPADPLLQSGTYIDTESTPNKGVQVDEQHVSDLPPAAPPGDTTTDVTTTTAVETAGETVTPVRKQNKLVDVNVERPSWLPENWKVETRVRTSGATAGTVDRYYYEPVSGRKFRSKNEVQYFLETGGKRKKANTSSDAITPSETTPNSKKQKKSGSKTKKITSFYFDSGNPPQSVCWFQTDSSADTWAASCNGSMVPESRKQEWEAVFSSVSHLRRRNV